MNLSVSNKFKDLLVGGWGQMIKTGGEKVKQKKGILFFQGKDKKQKRVCFYVHVVLCGIGANACEHR